MIDIIVILGLLCVIVFLLVKLKDKKSHDGIIHVTTNDNGGKLYSLELNNDPVDLDLKEYVIFKVTKNDD